MENQEIQTYEFTGETLAESLSLEWPTLRKKINRMGHRYGKDDLIPEDVVQEIVLDYAQPHPRRADEVVEGAQQVAGQLNIQINITNNSNTPAPKPAEPQHPKPEQTNSTPAVQPKALPQPTEELPKPQADPQAGGKPVTALVYFAFIFILLYQVEHLATIGMDVSAFPADSLARKISGWLFAVTVSITALLMTLRRGIKARISIFGNDISYLMAFAVLDVIFFVLSSAPLTEGNWLHWTKSILVGITTAFVIYSFNELITKK
ncbi:hypothetical protein [Phaeodactylibacter xiamenensis]|uniref:hypothetical protein n=1 Tax=Phaeodactylibacter xiamenensis TaxID=1524460 RepID=UPI0024A962FD|nr:hypothetical protein [Phaeodactylibacter xiamenensis]